MKTLPIVFVLIVVAGHTSAQAPDFRNVRWGMSVEAVKAAETSKLSQDSPRKLVYDCTLADNETKLFYVFSASNKLARTKYFVTPDYINMIFYIRDFKLIQELMIKKYGKPVSISPRAISKSAIPEEEWAAFLAAGELQVEVVWSLPTMDVQLTLSKVGEKPAIQIDYMSREYYKQDLKERSELAMKDL